MATVRLTPGGHHRVLHGHLWVYRTEIGGISGSFEPGDVVEVVDHRGRFVGRGYINLSSQIAVRLLTRDPREEIGKEFFRRRLAAALEYRRRVVRETNAFRLVFGEADFLPGLVVDRFGPYLSLQTLTLGMERWKGVIADLLEELLEPAGIYERNDASVRELEGLPLVKGFLKGSFDPLVEIAENSLRFLVDLAGGQKTGYFLDQRENRLALAGLAGGARVLDCFCHTGTFALYAARFGAKEVLGIDVDGKALALAQRNALQNGYEKVCTFREGNAFDELRALEKAGERFDLIILDPPAFTRSKEALEGALRGYKEINLRAMKLLPPGGFLVTCSCSYHVSEELFCRVLLEAARDVGRQLRLVEARRQAKDHPMLLTVPETYYLKCFVLQVW